MIVKRYPSSSRYRYGVSSHSNRSKYRYGGSGIFTIGRKLLGDNVKNLINSISKSKITQKAASAVLDGASNAIKTQTHKGLEELTSSAINNLKKKSKVKERQDIVNSVIQNLATIPSSVSGTGIVYD